MRSDKEEARASPNMNEHAHAHAHVTCACEHAHAHAHVALRSEPEKTRSALAEFGVMANMMRAATAHVGNFWPLRRQKSKA